MTADRPIVFCLRTSRLIDIVRNGETATTALARLQSHGPDLTVLPLAEAQRRYETQFKTDPVEIADTAWHAALNVLPPADWRNDAGGESFKSCEHTAGSVTAIYVRVGDRHFTFCDEATLPHHEILRRVGQSKAWQQDDPAR